VQLNDIKPGTGAKHVRKRRGRGMSSGLGKTGGRGHKGQNSRTGGGVRRGFEGGQMPLQRRLPKFGFSSRKSLVREGVRIIVLEKLEGTDVTLESLKEAGVISKNVRQVKIFGEAPLSRAYTVTDVPVTKGARISIEGVGGRIED